MNGMIILYAFIVKFSVFRYILSIHEPMNIFSGSGHEIQENIEYTHVPKDD